MTIDDIKEFYGSYYNCCKQLRFSTQTPQNWKRLGYIPITTQMKIERLSEGALKADLKDCHAYRTAE